MCNPSDYRPRPIRIKQCSSMKRFLLDDLERVSSHSSLCNQEEIPSHSSRSTKTENDSSTRVSLATSPKVITVITSVIDVRQETERADYLLIARQLRRVKRQMFLKLVADQGI